MGAGSPEPRCSRSRSTASRSRSSRSSIARARAGRRGATSAARRRSWSRSSRSRPSARSIASRQPGEPVGWLFLGDRRSSSACRRRRRATRTTSSSRPRLAGRAATFAAWSCVARPGSLRSALLSRAPAAASRTGALAVAALAPSCRARSSAAVVVLIVGWPALEPGRSSTTTPAVDNPIGIGRRRQLLGGARARSVSLLFACVARSAAASSIVPLPPCRAAIERQQLKWLSLRASARRLVSWSR